MGLVDFAYEDDLLTALDKLDKSEFKNPFDRCVFECSKTVQWYIKGPDEQLHTSVCSEAAQRRALAEWIAQCLMARGAAATAVALNWSSAVLVAEVRFCGWCSTHLTPACTAQCSVA
eukprot:1143684-Pelagomonas_calceolata.AAC.5